MSTLLADRRLPAIPGLGFSSGLPFLLVYITQSAWLSKARVPLATLGLMSELTIVYKLKFLWGPSSTATTLRCSAASLADGAVGSSPHRSR